MLLQKIFPRCVVLAAVATFSVLKARVLHYRLWSFKTRDTKLERFLHKNQHTQRKLLNFENWRAVKNWASFQL